MKSDANCESSKAGLNNNSIFKQYTVNIFLRDLHLKTLTMQPVIMRNVYTNHYYAHTSLHAVINPIRESRDQSIVNQLYVAVTRLRRTRPTPNRS